MQHYYFEALFHYSLIPGEDDRLDTSVLLGCPSRSEHSKCAFIYTLKLKDQVYDCFLDYINKVENLTGKKIKRLRCDNGKEYMNKSMYKLIREKGILLEPCPPYVHELNGTAERYNRTNMNSARCLLHDSKLNIKYWPEIVMLRLFGI